LELNISLSKKPLYFFIFVESKQTESLRYQVYLIEEITLPFFLSICRFKFLRSTSFSTIPSEAQTANI